MEDLSKHTINGYSEDSPIFVFVNELRAIRRKRTQCGQYVYHINGKMISDLRTECLSLFDKMKYYKENEDDCTDIINEDDGFTDVSIHSLLNGLSEEVKVINRIECQNNIKCSDTDLRSKSENITKWVECHLNSRVNDRQIEMRNSVIHLVSDSFKTIIKERRYELYSNLQDKVGNIDKIHKKIRKMWDDSVTTGHKSFSFLDI
jgi:hypothetical protein